MKKLLQEFKEFALKGNVMDMAIGMIIATGFAGIVTALTDCIINPIIGCFSAGGLEGWSITIGKAELYIGAFIMAIINFLILALVLFLLLKGMNKLLSLRKKEEAAPLTRKCPYCFGEIDVKASKCMFCTSDVEPEVKE